MDKAKFLTSLPASEQCHTCGTLVCEVNWQVRPCGGGHWLGLGIAQCSNCGNIHIAAAGTSKSAQMSAHQLRELLFSKIPK